MSGIDIRVRAPKTPVNGSPRRLQIRSTSLSTSALSWRESREHLCPCMAQSGTDQENSAVPDHLVSANRYVTGWASPSEARFSSRFVLCLVSEWAIDWQASVSFLL